MDNASQQQPTVQPQNPPQSPTSVQQPNTNHFLRNFLIIFGIFILIAIAGAGTYFLANQNKQASFVQSSASPTLAVASWQKPSSSQKGYPVVKPTNKNSLYGELYIYSLSTKELRQVDKEVQYGSGGDSGSSNPIPSPNLLHTAFIDTSSNLWIISNETLEAKKVTQTGGVNFISGWSPDSTKIIYQIFEDTIGIRADGFGGLPQMKEQFNPNLDFGFFVLDIDLGTTKKLYPLESFQEFIDKYKVLVLHNDNLIIFDINTFEADYNFVKEKFGFGANQFDISSDGKKWTYTLSRNPTDDANIIYTDFPQKEGEVIDSGDWTEVQFPKISPSGKKIAYAKRTGYIEPGIPNFAIWVYDATSKSKLKYNVEGFPEHWVDEQTLIVRASDASKMENAWYIVDLLTGSAAKIY